MNLTQAAIKRPVWVLMVMISLLVLGYRGLQSMRVEQNPEVEFPNITIQTRYFGASPEEVETLITKRIEDACSSLPRLQQVTSNSFEGVSLVLLEFELGTSLDVAFSDTSSKVEEIIGLLPLDAEKPVVSKLNVTGEPIIRMAVESDKLTPLQLRTLVDDRIKDAFSRISGVADVAVQGGQEREIRVAIRQNQLLSLGLGITSILDSLRGSTANIPGGRITEGRRETAVRVKGEFESLDEIKNLSIPVTDRQDPDKAPAILKLSDIADITDGPAERTAITRVNGRDSVILSVQKTREGNTIEITDQVKQAVGRLEKTFPVKFTITQESAKDVKESLEDLNSALFLGIILVIAIIYIFLHNFRGTLIVALAIPTCLFAAFAVIAVLGFTLNVMTMLGLSLAIGILVDDAIVVLENTYRHLTHGEPPQEAAMNGRMEIGLAALAITMVDVVVFLPMSFMGGITGQFMRPFAVTVGIATLFSLFVSFTLTPMLASRWYRKGENLEDKRGFAKWFDARLHAFSTGYRRILDKALKKRWVVFVSGFGFLIGVFMMVGGGYQKQMSGAIQSGMSAAFSFLVIGAIIFVAAIFFTRQIRYRILIGTVLFAVATVLFSAFGFLLAQNKGGPILNVTFFPPTEQGVIAVNITMPPGSSLERTLEVVERCERAAIAIPDVEFVTSTVGSGAASGFSGRPQGSQYATLSVSLKDKRALIDSLMFWKKTDLRTRSQNSIRTELQQNIGKVPDAQIIVANVGGFGPGGGEIQLAVTSLDPDKVLPAAEKVRSIISKVEGVVNTELSSKPGKPEMRLRPNRPRMADNDLSVAQLGAATRVLYEGNTDAKFRERGLEYDIRVNLSDDVRQRADLLEYVPVKFRNGNPVFIGDVTTVEHAAGPDKVQRVDRQRQVTASGYLLPGYIVGTVSGEIEKQLKAADLGEGVSYIALGEAQVQSREQEYLGQAFSLAIILVFFVLAALFDNVLYPFIIQLAQPQALVGAILGLMIAGRAFDIVGFIAIIMLVGLVGKNAILLVDFANTLRERGMNRHEALLESGQTRMRPILMTTLALILAMIPVALALGRGSEFRAPLGVIIIGGMTLSTMLTLFVIPCSYTIFDDLSEWIAKRKNRLLGKFLKQPVTAEETAPKDQ